MLVGEPVDGLTPFPLTPIVRPGIGIAVPTQAHGASMEHAQTRNIVCRKHPQVACRVTKNCTVTNEELHHVRSASVCLFLHHLPDVRGNA